MRISVLASSSRGNASVISAGDTTIMVDAGISAARICSGLIDCGLHLNSVQGIFITHEHVDHVRGLGVLAKKRAGLPLLGSRYLRQDICAQAPDAAVTYVEPGCSIRIGDITVTPFSVNHDAVDPLGYVFEHAGTRLAYVTDTGHVSKSMESILQGVDALYVESNYDEEMLYASGRPRDLIRRIEGRWGHLSNTQACDLVRLLAHPGLKHIILAHISPECNTPALATSAMQKTLTELQLPSAVLHTALQTARLPWIEL